MTLAVVKPCTCAELAKQQTTWLCARHGLVTSQAKAVRRPWLRRLLSWLAWSRVVSWLMKQREADLREAIGDLER